MKANRSNQRLPFASTLRLKWISAYVTGNRFGLIFLGISIVCVGIVFGFRYLGAYFRHDYGLEFERRSELETILIESEKAWAFGGALNGSPNRENPGTEHLNEKLSEIGISAVPILLRNLRPKSFDKIDEIYILIEKKIYNREHMRMSEQRRKRSIYTLYQLAKIRPDLADEITKEIIAYLQDRLTDQNSRSTNSINSEAWAQMWLCWILYETGATGHVSEALVLLEKLASEGTPSVSRAANAAFERIFQRSEAPKETSGIPSKSQTVGREF